MSRHPGQAPTAPAHGGAIDASASSRAVRRDALITAMILVPIVVMPDSLTIWGRNYLGVLLLCLGVVVAFAGWRRSELPACAVAGWLMFAGLGLSIVGAVSPRFALEAAFVPITGIGLLIFFGAGALSRVGIMYGILLGGAVVAVLTIVNFVSSSLLWIDLLTSVDPSASLFARLPLVPPRVGAVPELHPNLTAPVLYVALATGAALTRVPDLKRIVWLSSGLIAVALVATGSRAGILATVAGVLVVVYLNLKKTRTAIARVRRLGLVVGVAMTAVLVGVWATGFRPSFIFRSTFDDRLPVISVGLDMFADSPILGNGPGAFEPLFPLFGPDLYPGAQARVVWNSAHNGYVQSLLEYGVIGTTLIVVAMVLLVRAVIRAARLGGGAVRASTVALLGILVAFGLHSMVDSLHIHLAPLAFIGAAAGCALIDLRYRFRIPRPLAMGVTLIPVLAVPLVVAATVGAHLNYVDGLAAATEDNLDLAIRKFEAAASGDPLPVYIQALNFAQLESGLGGSTSSSAPELGAFEPPSIALNLAAVSLPASPMLASEQLKLVLPRIQGDEVALIQYGFSQLELEDREAAMAAFVDAVSINPWLSGSPFLERLPEQMGDEVLHAVYQANPCRVGDEWILNEVANDDQLLELSEDCRNTAAGMHAALALGDAQGVAALAKAALRSTPDDMVMRRLAGMAELDLGMTDMGRRNLALAARLGDPYAALALKESYPQDSVPVEVGALADSRSIGHSPVLARTQVGPVYLYGSVTMGTIGYRTGLPSPLITGPWEEAYTLLHAELSAT